MAIDLNAYQAMFDLKGTTALVAGGAGGIGSAVSAGLAALGCRVFLTARHEQKAEEVAQTIREGGGEAVGLSFDVESLEDLRQFSENLHRKVSKIDVLVNCVGTHIEAPAEEYSEEAWDHILSVNLKTAFFLSQEIAKHQIGSGGGKHIHITSVRGELGISRGYISYCASRGGMNMMIKQLATEWAKYGITVNGIAPTFTRTSLVARYLDDPAFYKPLVARIPLGRVCEPCDIAGLAMYLASHASDFITGQIICVDGGLTATQ
jgi:gluconate 5-dehydrogenase